MFTSTPARELPWGTGQASPTSQPSRPVPKLGAQHSPLEAAPSLSQPPGSSEFPGGGGSACVEDEPDSCAREGVSLASLASSRHQAQSLGPRGLFPGERLLAQMWLVPLRPALRLEAQAALRPHESPPAPAPTPRGLGAPDGATSRLLGRFTAYHVPSWKAWLPVHQ